MPRFMDEYHTKKKDPLDKNRTIISLILYQAYMNFKNNDYI